MLTDEREALRHLLALHLTERVVVRLEGQMGDTMYIITGTMGSGKTTYAYYATKAGYIKYLCRANHIAGVDECADYALRKYDICIGGECEEPDEIDEMLKDAIYVGDEDIPRLNNEIKAIAEGKRKKFKMLFLDDILATGLYHMGGFYKQLYLWFTRNTQFIRSIAKIILLTTQSIDFIPRPLRKPAVIITSDLNYDGPYFTRTALKTTHIWNQGKLIPYRYYDAVWRDELPKNKFFKLPAWLEEKIEQRKKKTILLYAKMLDEAIKREKKRRSSPFAFLNDGEN